TLISHCDSSEIADVFSQRELTLDKDAGKGFVLIKLFRETFSFCLKSRKIFLRKPITEIAVSAKFRALLVKTMRNLMPDHRSDPSIVNSLICAVVIKRWLQDCCGKNDLVRRWTVIRIHRLGCHPPLIGVHGFSNFRELSFRFKNIRVDNILKIR